MKNIHRNYREVNNLDDLIFANRHRSYGAYELRQHYNDRLAKAFFIAALLSILFLSAVISINKFKSSKNSQGSTLTHGLKDSVIIMVDPAFQLDQKRIEQVNNKELPTTIVKDNKLIDKKKDDKVDSTSTSGNNNSSIGTGRNDSTNNNRGGGTFKNDSVKDDHRIADEFVWASQVLPTFPGGEKAFVKYLQKYFDCSNPEIRNNEDGKIILRFAVMSNGSVKRVEVLRENVGTDCVEEAKSVLINSPHWNPGLQNNQPVNVMMVLPITIQRK